MKTKKFLVAAVIGIAIGAPIAAVVGDTTVPTTTPVLRVPFLHGSPATQASGQSELASLTRADEWINSPPLTAEALRGKVVLIDFWTYTCINWLRTLPYVRAWAEKYKDKGLVVVGVHAPEFSFEKNLANVRRAVKDLKVEYPVAVDNEHRIWRAFSNQYWPALYFIDAQGRVRHHHFGEGSYEQSEMIIQELLVEAGAMDLGREPTSVEGSGIEAAADWRNLRSGENYVGYDRTQNFASPGGMALDQSRMYAFRAVTPERLGAVGGVDGRERGCRAEQTQRTHRLPLSRPRSAPRHGTGGARQAGTLPRARRRTAARCCSWHRR
jgi:thiol-disulfide isomerase/thioredoxin